MVIDMVPVDLEPVCAPRSLSSLAGDSSHTFGIGRAGIPAVQLTALKEPACQILIPNAEGAASLSIIVVGEQRGWIIRYAVLLCAQGCWTGPIKGQQPCAGGHWTVCGVDAFWYVA